LILNHFTLVIPGFFRVILTTGVVADTL
jgi:hypothetical protein